MKFRSFFYVVFILALLLAACQPSVVAPAPNTESGGAVSTTAPNQEPYPAPDELQAQPTTASALYPDLQEGSQISWDQTMGMILNGEVREIVQNEPLQYTLMLKDGRSLAVVAPFEKALQSTLDRCGAVCQDITVR